MCIIQCEYMHICRYPHILSAKNLSTKVLAVLSLLWNIDPPFYHVVKGRFITPLPRFITIPEGSDIAWKCKNCAIYTICNKD